MRQRRWLELLKDYDTNIQYHLGKANVVADALSKNLGMIAGIKVEEEFICDLERLGIELYKEDSEVWTIIENLDKQVEFRLDDDNVLWQGTRLCVPNDATLREALLTEAHSSPFSVHLGSTKMYYDIKQHFWWSGMKRDVATFLSRCLIYQQVKIEHQWASGLLQPLDISVWKCDEISMDFVIGLPRTQRRHDAIWVVVDRLTKSAHFLPIRKDYSVSKLAKIFRQEIVRLHGTPSAIISDRDPCFTSRFLKGHVTFLCLRVDRKLGRLLQPLDIHVWKWDEISMDFVTGFPRTQRRHDAIWVVMDRLTKSAHFFPIRKDYSVSKLAKIFQPEIVRLHGTP
nr:retrotransposable element Tf2 [Tanacetum cinerariifolium]